MKNINRTVLKVSELNAEVGSFLKQGFPLLWVEGEISNLSSPASGHLYFSLKDARSQIRCALFKHRKQGLRFTPKNGQKVLVRGKIGLYEARGDFQLIAESMEDAGAGLLQQQFEALKAKLAAKGWFDPLFKQAIPAFPQQIGIISSPTGAALQDILQVLKRRCRFIPVLIYPVVVQGSDAALQLEHAIRQANWDQRCDVLILARGGGSIEDLAAFNDEYLAAAIYESKLPIVTGIGHEIDFTIADFVADQRAPTPSVAAELVSPDGEQLKRDLRQFKQKITQAMAVKFKHKVERFQWLSKRLEQQQPSYRLQQQIQRLDELETRLIAKMQQLIASKKSKINALQKQLIAHSPTHLITQQQQKLKQKTALLHQAMQVNITAKQSQLNLKMTKLNAMSPLKTLERGYAVVRCKDKRVISSVSQLKTDDEVNITLKDGDIRAKILDKCIT